MDPNTHSAQQQPGGLDRLAAVVDELATEDLDGLPDAEAAQRVLVLRGLIERLEGVFLRELAGVDGRGAAGADQGIPAESTAGWLRHRTALTVRDGGCRFPSCDRPGPGATPTPAALAARRRHRPGHPAAVGSWASSRGA